MKDNAVSIKIDKEIYDKLSIVCKEQGYKIKAYIEKAIEQRIEKEKENN